MEVKHPSIANRSYEDFDPVSRWRKEEGRDTLDLYLPGFRKDQVRVQLNHLGFMVISGESPLMDGTRWRRFKKEIKIPSNCNDNAINASFMQSILKVVMPKKPQEEVISPPISHEEDHETQTPKSEPPRRDHEEQEEEKEEELFESRVELTPEKTKEVAFKIFVVVIVMMVFASYVIEMCKNIVVDSHLLN